MNTYRLGLYEKSMPGFLSLPQKLEQTKAAGFDYMELSVDETAEKLARLEWDAGQCRELMDAICASGVPTTPSVCPVIGNILWDIRTRKFAVEVWRSWRKP